MVTTAVAADWAAVTASGSGGYTTHTWVTVGRYGHPLTQIPVSALQWSYDGSTTTPTSGSFTLPAIDFSDPANPIDYRPRNSASNLTPFGNTATVDVGVDNGTDPIVWMRLGTGYITDVVYNRPAETLDVVVGDMALPYLQALTTVDWSATATQKVGDLIGYLTAGIYKGGAPTFNDPGNILGRDFGQVVTWPPGTPYWEIIQAVVDGAAPGSVAWFDRDGRLNLGRLDVDTAAPPPTGPPSAVLATGLGGHITEIVTTLSRTDTVNLVAIAVEDTEVVEPTTVTVTGNESDMAGFDRKTLEGLAGTGSGFGKKLTNPSYRAAGGWTDKAPTPPRWPFASAAGHGVGAVFGQQGAIWSNNTHYGTDFSATTGDEVVSVCQGRIVFVWNGWPASAGVDGWAGNYVVQQASDGSRFMYCHLASVSVKVGDFLLRGQRIGGAGSTGHSTGTHLHLERRTRPYRWATNSVDWRRGGDVK